MGLSFMNTLRRKPNVAPTVRARKMVISLKSQRLRKLFDTLIHSFLTSYYLKLICWQFYLKTFKHASWPVKKEYFKILFSQLLLQLRVPYFTHLAKYRKSRVWTLPQHPFLWIIWNCTYNKSRIINKNVLERKSNIDGM